MLEEVEQPYQPVVIDMLDKREHKGPEYLKLNPNGKVPCLVDGDVTLWESMAINQYLCERYKPELLGNDPGTRGRVAQWNLWSLIELQPPMIDIIIQTMFTPEERRDHQVVARAQDKMPGLLKILDEALAQSEFIAGDHLTVADFNMASVFHITTSVHIPTTAYPHATRWYQAMRARPSMQRWIAARGGR
jgi:glutathione S-transferase